MQQYAQDFVKTFDGIDVSFVFNDMELWVAADDVLKILHLPHNALSCIPECERATLQDLCPCSDGCAVYITALAVGILTAKLVTRGCIIDNSISPEYHIPPKADAFANIFLTDVIYELREEGLLKCISCKETEVLNILLNDTSVV
ncbi:pep [Spodoptera litura granulovirus]|uniref:Pep n=1 Tax=Spodoptera litura granulovirus TaxID=359919 RepID=A5IZM0_9BBAC|nr:pep [Spodoptera litura granulovirus]ABQ51961.1 pep [Spodoptera litura granulovirus]